MKSTLHGRVSKELMVLTFTGRKTGKRYSTPVGYVRKGNDIYVLTHTSWWKNLRGGAPVTMRIQGTRRARYGAPKGSIYYYFPNGKDEITSEAVLFAGRTIAERIQAHFATGLDVIDVPNAVQTFVEAIAYQVEASGFHAGGPLTIVASETATTSERLNQTCRDSYGLLIDAFKTGLVINGIVPERAANLAMMITASIEGGIILSRTYHTGEPLRQVARELACILRNCAN